VSVQGPATLPWRKQNSGDGMFAFTAAGDFVRKAAGKLSEDGNFMKEGNFPTKDNFAMEGELTKEVSLLWRQLCCNWQLQHGDKFAKDSGVAEDRESSKENF
jgi:hypothetical protein